MSTGADMANSVLRLIKDRGRETTFRRVVDGTYDPDTGQATPAQPDDETALVAFTEYRIGLIDGTNVQRGDRKALMSAKKPNGEPLSKVPQADDLLVGGGNQVQVITVRKIEVGNVPVAYTCQVRE